GGWTHARGSAASLRLGGDPTDELGRNAVDPAADLDRTLAGNGSRGVAREQRGAGNTEARRRPRRPEDEPAAGDTDGRAQFDAADLHRDPPWCERDRRTGEAGRFGIGQHGGDGAASDTGEADLLF